jgi:Putative lumazine-binding
MIFQHITPAVRAIAHHQVRHHMTHGSGGANPMMKTMAQSGPREFVQIGLDAAQCSNNILRLLESSHGWAAAALDTVSTTWHPQGRIWRHDHEIGWTSATATSEFEQRATTTNASFAARASSSHVMTPRLLSMAMSDDRTALAKLIGVDGTHRYVTMLRLDPDERRNSMIANDGWLILREVVIGGEAAQRSSRSAFGSLHQALQTYLDIEHGGGSVGRAKAEQLFDPDATLISVGSLPPGEESTEWSAPAGSLLEISLSTYLDGVESQHPHAPACRAHDAIVSMDVCGLAASATVRVGNGAQSQVFDDFLLLGKEDNHASDWRILSKTFSPKAWS